VLNRNTLYINAFEAPNIDGGHPISLWIGAFSIRVNATDPAEAVLDNVLVERIPIPPSAHL
jgi:hypothetical protein